MKKIIFIIPFIFLGCSQKTVYPQVQGNILSFNQKNIKKINIQTKEKALEKVDMYANKIFNKLYNEIKNQQKNSYLQTLYNIYTNK